MENETIDVLIVGAGISGIGAAVHLTKRSPGRSFAIIEARERLGGTWDLFKYPGIRSDSDMYTLGYNFKPWTSRQAIADGPNIMAYLHETVEEYDLEKHIRYQQKVVNASWSSIEALWTVNISHGDGSTSISKCRFLFMCSGYYNYDEVHDPTKPTSSPYSRCRLLPRVWRCRCDWVLADCECHIRGVW